MVWNRREFLKWSCIGCVAGSMGRFADAAPSSVFTMVAAQDRLRILAAADAAMKESPITVTAFHAARSAGGKHDFFSQADYFWPNPANPDGPYINRDGQSNPDNFNDHRKAMIALSMQMPALTAAWLLTGNKAYGRKAAEHLQAWFVNAETRMNPNLEYAQAVIGVSTGRNYGIIDTLHLVEVARAASLLDRRVQPADQAEAVRGWFAEYLTWLTTSQRGREERDTKNNHAMCWALQVAEFARLTRNQPAREQVYALYRDVFLPRQMAPDGSFPLELARTKPYSYSIFNFDVLATLCQSLDDMPQDARQFVLADGRGLLKGAEFIYPFLEDKRRWRWTKDVEHFDALPVRSPGLLFAGIAGKQERYLSLWKQLNPDPTDREILRNYPIRQPLLWV